MFMLGFCSMLFSYYAQNYAGIIDSNLSGILSKQSTPSLLTHRSHIGMHVCMSSTGNGFYHTKIPELKAHIHQDMATQIVTPTMMHGY